jgi:predicted esterase
VLIFHGTGDTVVPAHLSETFAASHANVELRLLDSSHELGDVLDVMWTGMAEFLE